MAIQAAPYRHSQEQFQLGKHLRIRHVQAMVQPCQKAAIIPSCRVELEGQSLYLKAKLCTGRCPFLSNKYMEDPAALQARLIQAVSGEQQAAKDSYDRIYKRRSLPALRSSGISFEQCLLEMHAPPCDRLEFCPMSSANPVCLPLCPLRISFTCYVWYETQMVVCCRHDTDRHDSNMGHKSLPAFRK